MTRSMGSNVALYVTVSVAIFAGGFWVARASHPQAPPNPATSFPSSEYKRNVPDHTVAQPRDADRALTLLLARKVAALEQSLSKTSDKSNAVDHSDSAHPEPPSLTPAERAARNFNRIQRIDRALETEPRDGPWARATTRTLEDLFTSIVPDGSTLSDTTCGETFCRLVVKHEDQKARDEFEIFPRKVPGMGVRGLIEHYEDGTEQTTLYVVRKEYDTPEHPVRLKDSTS